MRKLFVILSLVSLASCKVENTRIEETKPADESAIQDEQQRREADRFREQVKEKAEQLKQQIRLKQEQMRDQPTQQTPHQ